MPLKIITFIKILNHKNILYNQMSRSTFHQANTLIFHFLQTLSPWNCQWCSTQDRISFTKSIYNSSVFDRSYQNVYLLSFQSLYRKGDHSFPATRDKKEKWITKPCGAITKVSFTAFSHMAPQTKTTRDGTISPQESITLARRVSP